MNHSLTLYLAILGGVVLAVVVVTVTMVVVPVTVVLMPLVTAPCHGSLGFRTQAQFAVARPGDLQL